MKNISVIGSGTMGNGIAQTFALFNFNVRLYDINSENLKKGEQTILKKKTLIQYIDIKNKGQYSRRF